MEEANGSILIIDDEQDLSSILSVVFNQNGYRTTSVLTGREALACLLAQRFDLVMLDLSLPDRDGLALIPEIHSLHPDVPVLVVTGNGSLDILMEALQHGAQDYVLKPFSPNHLVSRVGKLLSNAKIQ